jgi:glutamate-5-semialdehyde dehydrogenase
MMTSQSDIIADLGKKARKACAALAQEPEGIVNEALKDIAYLLITKTGVILTANQKDVEAANEKALSPAMIDRLTLTPERISAMADAVLAIRELPNPCNLVLEDWVRPNGLRIQKVSVPIGVLGMIYESRPNVTVDAAALCIKSRNAVILRGGSECFYTNLELHKIIVDALRKNGLSEYCVSMTPDTSREYVTAMLEAVGIIDVLIPRGGKGLTSRVMEEAKMPVFAHLDGNCHIYVHPTAREDVALEVIRNGKLRRTGICGATESLLLDKSLSTVTATKILQMLLDAGVEVRGDAACQKIDKRVREASHDDWSTEYLDNIISVKYVGDYKEAVQHINTYGSHHTDAILTEDERSAAYFLQNVDSSIVMLNASTQFADGGEFGFGGEIGIGTGKLHARGPVGVRQLTTFKYQVLGDGQIRP